MATKCIQPEPCECWIERESRCCASFDAYEACVQKRIAEFEAGCPALAYFKDGVCAVLKATRERAERAEAKIAELEAWIRGILPEMECRCEPCWTDRGLHSMGCKEYMREGCPVDLPSEELSAGHTERTGRARKERDEDWGSEV